MSVSAMHGVPLAPGDWSVIVPVIITGDPTDTAVCGADTVVVLGPLPKV